MVFWQADKLILSTIPVGIAVCVCIRDGVHNKQVLTWEMISYSCSFHSFYTQITAIFVIFNEFQYDPFRCIFDAHSFPPGKNEMNTDL